MVEAGVSCARFSRFSAKFGWSGGEFLAGVPGTMGGALAMNAGAFGSETWSLVEEVELVNRAGTFENGLAGCFASHTGRSTFLRAIGLRQGCLTKARNGC